jgi:hypothetical protein
MARTTILMNRSQKKISGAGTNLDKSGMPKRQHLISIIPDLFNVNAYQVDLKTVEIARVNQRPLQKVPMYN